MKKQGLKMHNWNKQGSVWMIYRIAKTVSILVSYSKEDYKRLYSYINIYIILFIYKLISLIYKIIE
jgi:hypothetical protein